MYKTVIFFLLAVLLAVTCGQKQLRPAGRSLETLNTETKESRTIHEELQRTEALIRHEMERLRQLKLQHTSLGRQVPSMPVSHQPQRATPVLLAPRLVPEAPRTVVPPAPGPVNQRHQVGQRTTVDAEEALARQQAESAHYTFNSAVADGINDNTNVREETRDGLTVRGLYSYSDGFYKRTVHYVADENGYRVENQSAEPIGDGPLYNDRGSADISSNISGIDIKYHITTADIAALNPAVKQQQQPQQQNRS